MIIVYITHAWKSEPQPQPHLGSLNEAGHVRGPSEDAVGDRVEHTSQGLGFGVGGNSKVSLEIEQLMKQKKEAQNQL